MPNTPLPAPPRRAGASRLPPTEEERELAAAFLSARFADDVLSLDAFEERVAAVYRVSTMAELNALIADLTPATPAAETASASPAPRGVAAADSVPAHDRRFAILANL